MANAEAEIVGQKIVSVRTRKGVSQVELSKMLGKRLNRDPESVRRTLINNEKGRNVPRLPFLTAIAEVLDEPLSSFLSSAGDGASRKAA